MQSKATTVEAYLRELPADRREIVSAIRSVILQNLDKDYEEGMQYGMIGYFVPHRVFPAGYHCDPKQPLPFACLASQKNHVAVYLMSIYMEPSTQRWFEEAWKKTGRKLDMGKSCVRFRKLEDCALDVIGEAIRRVPTQAYIDLYTGTLALPAESRRSGSAKKSGKKTTAKTPVAKNRQQTSL